MTELINGHWGDIVSLMILGAGGAILIWCPDPLTRTLGHELTGAGLLGLRMRSTYSALAGGGDGATGSAVSGVRSSNCGH